MTGKRPATTRAGAHSRPDFLAMSIDEVRAALRRTRRERAARRRHYARALATLERIRGELDECSRREIALDYHLRFRERADA